MKVPFFSTKESLANWARREAELIRTNGLDCARREYAAVCAGQGKAEWLKWNRIPADRADELWQTHIDWHKKNVAYLERKVRKLERLAAEC